MLCYLHEAFVHLGLLVRGDREVDSLPVWVDKAGRYVACWFPDLKGRISNTRPRSSDRDHGASNGYWLLEVSIFGVYWG